MLEVIEKVDPRGPLPRTRELECFLSEVADEQLLERNTAGHLGYAARVVTTSTLDSEETSSVNRRRSHLVDIRASTRARVLHAHFPATAIPPAAHYGTARLTGCPSATDRYAANATRVAASPSSPVTDGVRRWRTASRNSSIMPWLASDPHIGRASP